MAHDIYDYALKASNSVSVSDSSRIQHEMHISDAALRDYFAAKAMQGMCAQYADNWTVEVIVKSSYEIADAMLEARKQK